jgi:hypothetical protein
MALMEKIVSSVTKRGMITTQTLLNQGEAGSGQEPTNMQRRTLIGGALAALLSPSGQLRPFRPGQCMSRQRERRKHGAAGISSSTHR